METIDEIDKRILFELQQNARITNQDLADRVGLSPSPCLRRVRLLEERGVIDGYHARVNAEALEMRVTAFVYLTLESHFNDVVAKVEEMIVSIPQVQEAHLLAGAHDYVLRITCRSLAEYEEILRTQLRRIPSISSIQTTFAMNEVKRSGALYLD